MLGVLGMSTLQGVLDEGQRRAAACYGLISLQARFAGCACAAPSSYTDVAGTRYFYSRGSAQYVARCVASTRLANLV